MVALFIMSISTGLLLANYPDSTLRLTLLNNTHAFSLFLREAQIKGSAFDSTGDAGGYGVFIDSATPKEAILFSDSYTGVNLQNASGFDIGDGLYNTSISPDKTKKTLEFKEGFTFKKLCVASSTATEMSNPPSRNFLCSKVNGETINNLTVSFSRPSQTAHIYINKNSLNDFNSACVQLYSPKSPIEGHIRSVEIYSSGVITTSILKCDNAD